MRGYVLQLIAVLLFCFVRDGFAQTVVRPTVERDAAFAIIVDRETYDRVGPAVRAYRDAVEADGLSTYILVHDWPDPAALRADIRELHRKDPRLEGIVLVGDIPVAMVRRAQHMATAFRIDEGNLERFGWKRTSIPSDRFYDDFRLEFEFIRRDDADPRLFYYELTATSPQTLQPALYSGRIRAPVDGPEKYARLEAYLTRIAAQRRQAQPLRQALFFTGHGYYSEALNGWEGEALTLRELFPSLFLPGGQLKTLHFSSSSRMKSRLMTEVQQPDLDFAVFHAHGAVDAQLVTRYAPPRSIEENIEAIRFTLRSRLRTAQRRQRPIEEISAELKTRYAIGDEWLQGAFDPETTRADSLVNAALDITSADIRRMAPGAEFLVFDECYNGAFIEEGYVAGEYVFGNGTAIAAVGNSVNVMQDTWANEHIGLIGHGMRVGQWVRIRPTMEAHIIGDPTFRFAAPRSDEINTLLTRRWNDRRAWEALLDDPDVPVRALAVSAIPRFDSRNADRRLAAIYRSEPSFVVRMQALEALASTRSDTFHTVLETAITDPYEFIRRSAAQWMGDVGHARYLPALIERMHTDPSNRVNYVVRDAIEQIDAAGAVAVNEAFISTLPNTVDSAALATSTSRGFTLTAQRVAGEELPTALDRGKTPKQRIAAIRTFRVYRYRQAIEPLVQLALSEDDDATVRAAALEALGWFAHSASRDAITDACRRILSRRGEPDAVRTEARRTLNRIEQGFTQPITH